MPRARRQAPVALARGGGVGLRAVRPRHAAGHRAATDAGRRGARGRRRDAAADSRPEATHRLATLVAPASMRIAIAIGLEGGWSPRDLATLTEAGFAGLRRRAARAAHRNRGAGGDRRPAGGVRRPVAGRLRPAAMHAGLGQRGGGRGFGGSRSGSSALCSPSSTRMCTPRGSASPRKRRPAGRRAAPRSAAGTRTSAGRRRAAPAARSARHHHLCSAVRPGRGRSRPGRRTPPAAPASRAVVRPLGQAGVRSSGSVFTRDITSAMVAFGSSRRSLPDGSGHHGLHRCCSSSGRPRFSHDQRSVRDCASSAGTASGWPRSPSSLDAAGSYFNPPATARPPTPRRRPARRHPPTAPDRCR